MKIKSNSGVTYRMSNWSTVSGIEVEPGITEVEFNGDDRTGAVAFNISDTGVQFPDVKTLIIGENVSSIHIPNMLFPNLENVVSDNKFFESGDKLVKIEYVHGAYNDCDEQNTEKRKSSLLRELLNVFKKSPDYVVDVAGISFISDGAFDGCQAMSVKNADKVFDVSPDAFIGSDLLLRQEYKNGVKMADSILIDIDEKRRDIVIPKTVGCVRDGIGLSGKTVSIYDSWILQIISNRMPYANPETIVFPDFNADFAHAILDDNRTMARNGKYVISTVIDTMPCENIVIENENSRYKTIDGIIYSADGKTLLKCGAERKGTVIIPEGVKKIGRRAFYRCEKINAVQMPNSVVEIGNSAFAFCDNLHDVKFGNELKSIDKSAFYGCKNLVDIDFSKNLKNIGDDAFFDTGIKKITLPASVREIGKNAFRNVKKVNLSGDYPAGLLESVMEIYGSDKLQLKTMFSGTTAGDGVLTIDDDDEFEIIKITIYGRDIYIPRYVTTDGLLTMICNSIERICIAKNFFMRRNCKAMSQNFLNFQWCKYGITQMANLYIALMNVNIVSTDTETINKDSVYSDAIKNCNHECLISNFANRLLSIKEKSDDTVDEFGHTKFGKRYFVKLLQTTALKNEILISLLENSEISGDVELKAYMINALNKYNCRNLTKDEPEIDFKL